MKINGVTIDDTFAEAFPMKATRLIITAMTLKYAYIAANSLTGFASSVIACGCEADIERELKPEETPDGRPGVAIIMFAMSKSQLADQLTRRVGQSVMTTATSACFAGTHSDTMLPLGKSLRYFGDGHQISKILDGIRYWRIPVMHGEFLCEETTGVVPAIGGGNFLVMAKNFPPRPECLRKSGEGHPRRRRRRHHLPRWNCRIRLQGRVKIFLSASINKRTVLSHPENQSGQHADRRGRFRPGNRD